MSLEIDLFYMREGEKLVGVSLIAGPEHNSERFCEVFPRALRESRVAIDVGIDVAIFTHRQAGSCSFEIDESDAEELQHFLYQTGPYESEAYEVHVDGSQTPGFSITLEGKRNVGDRSEPIHSNR